MERENVGLRESSKSNGSEVVDGKAGVLRVVTGKDSFKVFLKGSAQSRNYN